MWPVSGYCDSGPGVTGSGSPEEEREEEREEGEGGIRDARVGLRRGV